MVRAIVFSDEITLWWEKQWELSDGVIYRVTLNGDIVGETVLTHFSLCNLDEKTAYRVKVERIEDGVVKECLASLDLSTPEAKRRIDVSSAPYFAKGDGATLNTEAIQRAIDDCGANDCVYFPKGIFLSGALNLHSDMEIYLDEDATLQGTARVEDYLPKRKSRFEGIEMMCYSSLLNMGELDHSSGPNCRNVIIRGRGSVLGGGTEHCKAVIEYERELLKEYLNENDDYIKTCENDSTIPGRARPRLVNISNAENVILANTTFGFGASWNIHFIYSRNIVTYGCKILSQGVWNGDGWDPDSSEDCVIFDTEFRTYDNSIAIKSGKNPEGNIIARPCSNIRIFDCRGGNCMALGSEMSGGISDIYIWDCDFSAPPSGIGLKVTKKRGGYIKRVRIRNSRFVNIRARCVSFNDDGEAAKTTPQVEDILFENITLTGDTRKNDGKPVELIQILGVDGEENYFRNITLNRVLVPAQKNNSQAQINIKNVKDLTLKNITFYE